MNDRFDAASPPPTSRTLNAALSSRGFETEDFRLEEVSSADLAQWLGVSGGILKVRCCSTGEERFYSTGTSSAWLGAFMMDLGRGHFAGAARRGNSVQRPLSQRAPQRLNA